MAKEGGGGGWGERGCGESRAIRYSEVEGLMRVQQVLIAVNNRDGSCFAENRHLFRMHQRA